MNPQLLIVMAGALIIAALVRRQGFQANLIILVIASAVSFVPNLERLELEPHVILGLVVPPLLYSAALNFSFSTFGRNFRSIVGLGVTLVVGTTAAAAFVGSWLLPGIGLAGAFVLASVISPPDTVTAVAHGKSMGFPRRVIAILTGESLVNDAAALTLFSIAVAGVTGESTFIGNPFLLFGYGVFVGVLVGFLLAGIVTGLRSRLVNSSLATALSVLVPFAAYFIAEELHASGVIAVVMAGFSMAPNTTYGSNRNPSGVAHRLRLQEHDVWPVVEVILEAFVFAYIGLQVRFVIDDLVASGDDIPSVIIAGVVLLVLVVAIRMVWSFVVFGGRLIGDGMRRRRLDSGEKFAEFLRRREEALEARGRQRASREQALGWKEILLVSWTGMRGIVTLAAAAAIPLTAAGEDFPGRASIQVIAFIVAIGTLLLQGFTVPVLARRLRIDSTDDDAAEDSKVAAAQAIADEAGADAVPNSSDWFHAKRAAVGNAVRLNQVDDEIARVVIRRIDLRQAAAETSD